MKNLLSPYNMYKILVVNDDINSLQTIVSYIEESNSNYIVFQALNGLTGLKIAIDKQPDLIIADWDMPGMDGITYIKELKVMISQNCMNLKRRILILCK